MTCPRCVAEAADAAAKAEAAYLANGYVRIINAIRHEDELVEKVAAYVEDRIRSAVSRRNAECIDFKDAAKDLIDVVRAFDENTALMRDAHDDHQAQNNEGQQHAY